jgi:hypothetical protein
MFRRLENCVKQGTPMQKGDWELLFVHLAKVAAEKKSMAKMKAAGKALWEFFSPDTAARNPSIGPIELYFEQVLDQICRLQTAGAGSVSSDEEKCAVHLDRQRTNVVHGKGLPAGCFTNALPETGGNDMTQIQKKVRG